MTKYRYCDGNTYTDYRRKRDAVAQMALQNGGTVHKFTVGKPNSFRLIAHSLGRPGFNFALFKYRGRDHESFNVWTREQLITEFGNHQHGCHCGSYECDSRLPDDEYCYACRMGNYPHPDKPCPKGSHEF